MAQEHVRRAFETVVFSISTQLALVQAMVQCSDRRTLTLIIRHLRDHYRTTKLFKLSDMLVTNQKWPWPDFSDQGHHKLTDQPTTRSNFPNLLPAPRLPAAPSNELPSGLPVLPPASPVPNPPTQSQPAPRHRPYGAQDA